MVKQPCRQFSLLNFKIGTVLRVYKKSENTGESSSWNRRHLVRITWRWRSFPGRWAGFRVSIIRGVAMKSLIFSILAMDLVMGKFCQDNSPTTAPGHYPPDNPKRVWNQPSLLAAGPDPRLCWRWFGIEWELGLLNQIGWSLAYLSSRKIPIEPYGLCRWAGIGNTPFRFFLDHPVYNTICSKHLF